MSISVIVSNFNGSKYLPKLLETLQAQESVDLEIIIVDRKSTDASHEILARYPALNVITEPPESGLVSGYAAGARVAKNEHFFFCNEDMWFDPKCLYLLEKWIDLEKGIVAADPWQWTYDGSIWIHGGTRFKKTTWCFFSPYPRRVPDYNVKLNEGDPVPYPCAGAFLIHRQAYEAVGGWDGSFFLDQEDIDLGIRLWQRGWSVVTVPDSKVYHAVNVSNTKQISGGKVKVSSKRYISGISSVSIIPYKYFSLGAAIAIAGSNFLAIFLKDALRLYYSKTRLNLVVAKEILRRLPQANEYRKNNRQLNKQRPVQKFFLSPTFNE
jgi:GT2 family glycosyltransferase